MKKHFALNVLLIIIILTTAGCYTVLNRPGEERGAGGGNDDRSDYYYPDYWRLYPNWGHYYTAPWWWEYPDLYHDDDYEGENSGSVRPSSAEKAIESGSRWEGGQSTGTTTITRGEPGSSGSSSGGVNSQPVDKSKQTKSDEGETKTKEEKSDSRETRDGGRWQNK